MPKCVHIGDCREWLASLPENSADAIVCDPPYELGFMGKKWDRSGIAYDPETWAACLRAIKPGGHMLTFGGSRTYHRIACAIEDGGFEIRDTLQWLYGTGFPKSLNVSKKIADGLGLIPMESPHPTNACPGGQWCECGNRDERSQNGATRHPPAYTWPEGSEPQRWQGYGTALKPAYEPIIMARKPLSGTVAANVLEYGTGAINVDGCRIGTDESTRRSNKAEMGYHGGNLAAAYETGSDLGRWPANVILDPEAAAMLDEQSGITTSPKKTVRGAGGQHGILGPLGAQGEIACHGDTGGASRFFYCAKASRAEREAGLDHMRKATAGELTDRKDGSDGLKSPRAGAGRTSSGRANVHPTVKPIALMRYLVRLVTPPGGLVIDPFVGSGTTGCAALLEGFRFHGAEQSAEYAEIAESRIAHWQNESAGL